MKLLVWIGLGHSYRKYCKNYEATSARQNLFSENYVLFIMLDLLAYLHDFGDADFQALISFSFDLERPYLYTLSFYPALALPTKAPQETSQSPILTQLSSNCHMVRPPG